MKIKLYEVHLQHPKYSGEYEYVTVQAPNIKCAIDRALKHTWINNPSLRMVEDVKLIGVAQNT